jgi:hypothetical protein
MFKVISRIVIILLAAGIVAAGLALWVNTSGSSLTISGHDGGIDRQPPAGQLAASPTGNFKGGDTDGDFGGGVQIARSLQDMASKIGIIALITACVAIFQRGFGWITRRRQPAQALRQP